MMMALLDQNGDGVIQTSEFEGETEQMLRGIDENGNHVVTDNGARQTSGAIYAWNIKVCEMPWNA